MYHSRKVLQVLAMMMKICLLVPKYKDNSRLRWTVKRFECDYITVTTLEDCHVRSVHFVGDEYEHVMRLEFLDHDCWTGRMILVLIATVLIEYDLVLQYWKDLYVVM